jgi:hypothetical protein
MLAHVVSASSGTGEVFSTMYAAEANEARRGRQAVVDPTVVTVRSLAICAASGSCGEGDQRLTPVGNLAISSRPMRLTTAKCLNQNIEHSRHALCLSIARLARSFLTVWAASRSYQQLRGAGNGRESWAHA